MLNLRQKIKNLPFIGTIAKKLADFDREYRGLIKDQIYYLKARKFLFKNAKIENSLSDKKVFVIACGPSIKNQDLSQIGNHPCITVSNFFVHQDFSKLNVVFHVFAASHTPILDEQIIAWWKDAAKHFKKGQNVFVALTDKYLIDRENLFADQNVFYYKINYKKDISPRRKIDFTRHIPTIKTVAHIAMYLGIFTGSKDLNLVGFDHDWILHVGKSMHFYEEKQSAMVVAGYNENTKTVINEDFEAVLNSNIGLWKTYKKIKVYTDAFNIKVTNVTPGSLLDVFPRRKLEDVLNQN
ncbi:MAG: hypothetical protein WCW87_03220 [Candidatus Paceibacterota bacterium]